MNETSQSHPINTIEQLEQSSWGKLATDPKLRKQLPGMLKTFIKRVGKDSPIAQRACKAMDLFTKESTKETLVNPRNVLIVAAALLYTFSPLDFVPDMIPVVGWLDDLGVLAMALSYIRPSDTKKEEEDSAPEQVLSAALVHQSSHLATGIGAPLQEKLQQLRSEVADLDDGELLARCDELEAMALDPLRRVIVTGAFSTGKSSIINRLLEDNCLPAMAIPTTPVLTTLVHGEELLGVASGKDGSIETLTTVEAIQDMDSPTMKQAEGVLIYHPARILSEGFSIVDTPGIQDVHGLDVDELPRSDAFVFVTSTEAGSWSKQEATFLAKVAEKGLANQLILILNKTDLVDRDDEEAIVADLRLSLLSVGLANVPLFRLRGDGGEGDELPALRAELLRRAKTSMQSQHETYVNEAAEGLMSAVARMRKRQEELAHLSAKEQEARKERLKELKLRVTATVQRRADALRETAAAELHGFMASELRVQLESVINQSPLDDNLPGRITACIRQSLGTWLEKECAAISENLGALVDDETRSGIVAQAAALGVYMPENSMAELAKYAKFVLPTIAIVTFFPMGIFAWLTSVAVPTFLLDWLGVGGGMQKLLLAVGGTSLRSKIREQVAAELTKLESTIKTKLEEAIEAGSHQIIEAECRALEMSI